MAESRDKRIDAGSLAKRALRELAQLRSYNPSAGGAPYFADSLPLAQLRL